MNCCLYWSQGPSEDDPGQDRFGRQAEDNVETLTEEVIFPTADFLVLQHHVDGKDVEEDKQSGDDEVDERGRLGLTITGVNRSHEVDNDNDPRQDAGENAIDEGGPIGFNRSLIELLHKKAKEVHRGVNTEDEDQGANIPQADQHADKDDHQRGA